jgi:hypothetical protein
MAWVRGFGFIDKSWCVLTSFFFFFFFYKNQLDEVFGELYSGFHLDVSVRRHRIDVLVDYWFRFPQPLPVDEKVPGWAYANIQVSNACFFFRRSSDDYWYFS